LELFLRNLLRTDAEIKTLVGTDSSGYAKVYSIKALQDEETTYITITLISKARREMGSRQYRIQFSVFAKSYGQAKTIANAIEDKITEVDGLNDVFAVYPENQLDLYDDVSKLYHIPVDVMFYRINGNIGG